MGASSIEWTDCTWNPVRGCALVSPGCENCYAMKQAHRFSGKGGAYEGLTVLGKHGPRWIGTARFVPEMLGAPLKWRKPKRIFVNSMSDLFHDDITNEQIAAVFGVMASCPQHTFQVLTKRPKRMKAWFEWIAMQQGGALSSALMAALDVERETHPLEDGGPLHIERCADPGGPWPLPNVWVGVSCEDQQRAYERIELLLQTPAAVRFVSAEPLLGPIEFDADWMLPRCKACGRHSARGKCCEFEPDCTGGTEYSVQEQSALLDWVIVGGESAPRARPCDVEWIRSIVTQCRNAGTAVFVKQLGAHPQMCGVDARYEHIVESWLAGSLDHPKGGDIAEWPRVFQVRDFPAVRP